MVKRRVKDTTTVLTDVGGDDAGDINATNPGEVTVAAGALASGGGTGTVTFDVTVN